MMDKEQIIASVNSRSDPLVSKMLEWSRSELREFPWRDNPTPFSVLVAEVLLRRTTASAVSRVYEDFLDSYPDLESLAVAERDELENRLTSIGYYRQRSKFLKEMAQFIIDEYKDIPTTKKELLRIPHVGPYTAGAILSIGLGVPSGMVDSNVERIFRRFFSRILPEKTPFSLFVRIADEIVPDEEHARYNLSLLDLGSMVCRYDYPRCSKCPLVGICDYPKDHPDHK